MADNFTLTRESAVKVGETVRRVLGRSDSTVDPEALRSPESFWRLGKTDEAITKGATGTISIYSAGSSTSGTARAAKGSETDAGRDIEAYARMGAIDANKWVYVYWLDGGWEVVQAEC